MVSIMLDRRGPRWRVATRRVGWRRLTIGVAFSVLGAGCGQDETPVAATIRLIDLAAAVDIDSPSGEHGGDQDAPRMEERFDSIALGDLHLHDAQSLRAAGLNIAPSAPGGEDRLIGEGADRHLVIVPGSVLVLVADVAGAAAAEVSLRLWGEASGAPQVGAFVLPDLPDDHQIDRPQDVARFSVGRGFHRLTPAEGVADPTGQLHSCIIDPLLDAKGLMLVVWNAGAELHIDDVSVKAVAWSAEQIADAGSADHAVRAVTVGFDRRLAYVLTAGSTLRCPVQLPTPAPFFRFAVAPFKGARDPDLEVRVVVRIQGETAKEWAATLSKGTSRLSGTWREAEIDLTGFDHRDAMVELHVSSPGPGGVAFAEPTVLARPSNGSLLPDVVLISLDTVRADRLSLYGHDQETSPNLSRLAAESCVFDNCIASASWTLPSHVTLLTGQLPLRHGVLTPQHRIDPDHSPLLATELRRLGYQTIAFTGGGFVDPDFGFATGFDSYGTRDIGLPNHQFVNALVGVPAAERRRLLGDAPLERVLTLLAEKARPRPRFVFLHTYVAHNYRALEDDLRALGVSEEELAELTNPQLVDALRGEAAAGARHMDRTDEDKRRLRLVYDATLRRADRIVGQVVAALEAAGRLDQTLLIVTSDHGEALLEHGISGHRGHLYETVIHVPLLVRGPGVEAGRVSTVVTIADIAPTLRAAIGLGPPASPTDGRSLMGLLARGRAPPEPALALAGDGAATRYALRGDRWKLHAIEKDGALVDPLLFDLVADPAEDDDQGTRVAGTREQMLMALRRRIASLSVAGATLDEAELDPDLLEELRAIGYTIGR